MKMNPKLIKLQEKDIEIVKEIYDHYVLNSTATFYTVPLSIQDLKGAIPINHPKYKSFLIHHNNSICGYCYISQYKNRQAYNRTAEFTLYLKPEFTGKGIGRFALQELEKIAKELQFKVLIGIISADNRQSIALCEKCGYEKCAHFKQVGEKFGKILDVVAYQKLI
jgi:phosphinothricin acetyltransferase